MLNVRLPRPALVAALISGSLTGSLTGTMALPATAGDGRRAEPGADQHDHAYRRATR